MNNYGICPHCNAVNPAGSSRERNPFGKTICGACLVPSLSMAWKTAQGAAHIEGDQCAALVAKLEAKLDHIQQRAELLNKEIIRLADVIVAQSPGEPRGDESIVDTAIRMISHMAEMDEQIGRLASFITANVTGEPSQNEGAVDTAIRLLADQPRRSKRKPRTQPDGDPSATN